MDLDSLKAIPESFDLLSDFFKTAVDLKSVPRQGWKDKTDILSPESVSDHCFSMTIMAMSLGDLMELDTSKLMKMSLIHDLAESKIGDITPEMMSKKEKESLEQKAMKKILESLPSKLKQEYTLLWEDYSKKLSKESLVLHEIDKLEMAYQAVIYSQSNLQPKTLLTFIETAKNEIKTPEIKKILEKILKDFNTNEE